MKIFLFCKSITGSANAQALFLMLDKFVNKNDLNWRKCMGMCTDAGRSRSGRYGGLQALIRSKVSHAMWPHCIIHRKTLATTLLSHQLNLVLERTVDVVNYIRTRPLKVIFQKSMY